jgi:hypothetical protein
LIFEGNFFVIYDDKQKADVYLIPKKEVLMDDINFGGISI